MEETALSRGRICAQWGTDEVLEDNFLHIYSTLIMGAYDERSILHVTFLARWGVRVGRERSSPGDTPLLPKLDAVPSTTLLACLRFVFVHVLGVACSREKSCDEFFTG